MHTANQNAVNSFIKYRVNKYLLSEQSTMIHSSSQISTAIHNSIEVRMFFLTHILNKSHSYTLLFKIKLRFLKAKMRLPQVRFVNFKRDIRRSKNFESDNQ